MATAETSRLGLTRQSILEAALGLLDREGLSEFSMRRLAGAVGVGTMTLYGYFRTKDELLDAVVDLGAHRLDLTPPRGSWRARLRAMMTSLHANLVEHPGIIELRMSRPLVSPGALRLTEAAMQLLLAAGFTPRAAARGYRSLFVYTFGFAAFGPDRRPDRDRDATVAAVASLSARDYPALTRVRTEAARATADHTLFQFGLDALLDGLERERRRDRAAKPRRE